MATEEQIHIGEVKSNLCFAIVGVLKKNIERMFSYCKENQLYISREEMSQWKMLLNVVKRLEGYKWSMPYEQIKLFNDSVNKSDVFLRLLISKIEGIEEFKMWQFYNYVRNFPCHCTPIAPTNEEEVEAFPNVLNGGA